MSLESDVLKNISQGFKFFSGWLDAILKKSNYCLHIIWVQIFIHVDPKYPTSNLMQREFLSWQSEFVYTMHNITFSSFTINSLRPTEDWLLRIQAILSVIQVYVSKEFYLTTKNNWECSGNRV